MTENGKSARPLSSSEKMILDGMSMNDFNAMHIETESSNSSRITTTLDVSSSEEEKRKRKSLKDVNWKKGLPKPDVLKALIPTDLGGSDPARANINIPIFQSIDALTKLYPHLEATNVVCVKSSSKKVANSSSNSSSLNEFRTLKVSASEDPLLWNLELLKWKEQQLMMPSFYIRGAYGNLLSQEELTGHIKNREITLPILNADFMSELLKESGEFQHPSIPLGETRHFPGCSKQNSCVGMRGLYSFRGPYTTFNKGDVKVQFSTNTNKKFIFTQLMFPHEYEEFLRDSTKPPPRNCVACCIVALTEFVLADRAMAMNCDEADNLSANFTESNNSSRITSTSIINNSSNFNNLNQVYGRSAVVDRVFQLFRNPIGVEQGFFREYTLCDPEATDVFVDPILRLNISTAFLEQDQDNGRIGLNINMMKWRAKNPEQPKLGEKLSNF